MNDMMCVFITDIIEEIGVVSIWPMVCPDVCSRCYENNPIDIHRCRYVFDRLQY